MEVKLAVSLHAPNQALREKIMPIAKVYPLDKLMKTIDAYVKATDNRIFYEYIMIKDITDTPEIAKELVNLLQGRLAHVNLIPYNENPAIDLKESDSGDGGYFYMSFEHPKTFQTFDMGFNVKMNEDESDWIYTFKNKNIREYELLDEEVCKIN